MTELTQQRLKELLRYDPETGEFWWMVAAAQRISSGDKAGHKNVRGYIDIRIDGIKYRAPRLAFLYMTGKFPDKEADHKDGDRSNNRWTNLREATSGDNKANTMLRSDNTSGLKGVHWNRRDCNWRAQICANGRRIFLGYFDTPKRAHEVYLAAAKKHFGEFACSGER
jgi:HNH endonuclease